MRVTSADPTAAGDDYIQYQGENARSVIDEKNLQRIADQEFPESALGFR